jgi:hypothetical protein
VTDGADVWVANLEAGSVTEISSAGNLVRVISDPRLKLDDPGPLTMIGSTIWATNKPRDSVTDFSASTGRLIRIFSDAGYQFDGPDGIASDPTRVWVANADGQTITQIPV